MQDKIAICAIAKNENLYIRDWVEYHKNLGIDKIFLYDNNDINGEHFEDVISDYINSKYVVVFNKRGIEKGIVYDKDNINLQPKCYIETYNQLKNNNDFKWIFFIDIDEYINIKTGTLKEYLNDEKYDNYDTIVFPWVNYNDNNKLKYEPGSLIDRFPNKSIILNKEEQVKCCVRIGKDIKDYHQFLLIHYIILNNEKVCYETGESAIWQTVKRDINKDNKFVNVKKIKWFPSDKIKDCNITINHYRFKTLEEYLLRQYRRHWGSTKQYTYKPKPIQALAEIFFNYNERTKEKEQIFENLKNIMLNGKIVVNIMYKSNEQTINILNKLNNQALKPTNVLIHIDKNKVKALNLSFKKYNFKISYYYNTDIPKYPVNKLIKENDLKYKIILNNTTKYDDQFLKTLIIKSLFK